MSFLKRLMMTFVALSMALHTPLMAQAQKLEKAPTLKEQELIDVFALLPPSQKGEKIAQLLGRFESRINPEAMAEISNVIQGRLHEELPAVEVRGAEAWIESKKHGQIHIKGEINKKGNAVFHINGMKYEPKKGVTVAKLFTEVDKVMVRASKASKKNSALYSLFIPRAEAFLFGMDTSTLLMGALAIGGAFMLYNNYKNQQDEADKQRKAQEAAQCPIVCCGTVALASGTVVGGSYFVQQGKCCPAGTMNFGLPGSPGFASYCCASNAGASAGGFCGTATANVAGSTAAPKPLSGQQKVSAPFSPGSSGAVPARTADIPTGQK